MIAGLATTFVYLILAASVANSVFGVRIAWRSLRSRRRGQDPHCRRCNYNLRGTGDKPCPECGATERIVGEWAFSISAFSFGLFLSGFGSAGLCLSLHELYERTDWYAIAPNRFVENWAMDGDFVAMLELHTRIQHSAYRSYLPDDVFDYAFENQFKFDNLSFTEEEPDHPWVAILEEARRDQLFSDAQLGKYLNQFAPELMITPKWANPKNLIVTSGRRALKVLRDDYTVQLDAAIIIHEGQERPLQSADRLPQTLHGWDLIAFSMDEYPVGPQKFDLRAKFSFVSAAGEIVHRTESALTIDIEVPAEPESTTNAVSPKDRPFQIPQPAQPD